MLPPILLKSIKKVAAEHSISDESEITTIFDPYFRDNTKKFIYPGVVSRKLNISIDQAFILLNTLKSEGILEGIYEFRCPDSDYRELFKDTNYINLPETIICEDCDAEFSLRDCLYVIYEVKKIT